MSGRSAEVGGRDAPARRWSGGRPHGRDRSRPELTPGVDRPGGALTTPGPAPRRAPAYDARAGAAGRRAGDGGGGRVGRASYTGPGPLTAVSALATWTLDVPAVVAVIAAAALYAGGVGSARRAGGRWPALRTAAFAAGLVLIALAACSFVGVYAHVLFWVSVVQACLLLLVAPLLLGAGAPLSLAAATPRHEPAAERAKRSRSSGSPACRGSGRSC